MKSAYKISAIALKLHVMSFGNAEEKFISSNLRGLQRTPLFCRFLPICSDEIVCTQDVQECPGGSYVSRDPSNSCEFEACPEMMACTKDLSPCPDGSLVGRDPYNNCEFEDCPDPKILCAADVLECSDGSYVSRNPDNNCNFDDCPDSTESCIKNGNQCEAWFGDDCMENDCSNPVPCCDAMLCMFSPLNNTYTCSNETDADFF